MKFPRAWTNAGDVTIAGCAETSMLFTIDALRQLIVLLDALKQRA